MVGEHRATDGTRLWKSAPDDAFGGAGAGHQFLLVVPSLGLIVVRNGQRSTRPSRSTRPWIGTWSAPWSGRSRPGRKAPYPPSPVIEGIRWAPTESIVRRARGSDTWPMTWADDDAQYTAYGDGRGFEPFVPEKLSLGFARVVGPPEASPGLNVRSATGERKGDGAKGEKASGMLSVGGALYLNNASVRLVDVLLLHAALRELGVPEPTPGAFDERAFTVTADEVGALLTDAGFEHVASREIETRDALAEAPRRWPRRSTGPRSVRCSTRSMPASKRKPGR